MNEDQQGFSLVHDRQRLYDLLREISDLPKVYAIVETIEAELERIKPLLKPPHDAIITELYALCEDVKPPEYFLDCESKCESPKKADAKSKPRKTPRRGSNRTTDQVVELSFYDRVEQGPLTREDPAFAKLISFVKTIDALQARVKERASTNELFIHLVELAKVFMDFQTDLCDEQKLAQERMDLVNGRPLMVLTDMKPRYVKDNHRVKEVVSEKGDTCIQFDSQISERASNPVFIKDGMVFKQCAEGDISEPGMDFLADILYELRAGFGSTPTKQVTIRHGNKSYSFLVSLKVDCPNLNRALNPDIDKAFKERLGTLHGDLDGQLALLRKILEEAKTDEIKVRRVLKEFEVAKGNDKEIDDLLMREEAIGREKAYFAKFSERDEFKFDAVETTNEIFGQQDKNERNLMADLTSLDNPECLAGEEVVEIGDGKHQPNERDIMPMFPEPMSKKLSKPMVDAIRGFVPARQMLVLLRRLKQENQKNFVYLRSGLLTQAQYDALGYPVRLKDGTMSWMYARSLREWLYCHQTENPTRKERSRQVNPLQSHFIEAHYDPKYSTLGNYARIFDARAKEPCTIEDTKFYRGLKENDPLKIKIDTSKTRELDYQERHQSLTDATSKLVIDFRHYNIEQQHLILEEYENHKDLLALTLLNCDALDDECLINLVKQLPLLNERLTIIGCNKVTSEGLIKIHKRRPELAIEFQACDGVSKDVWPKALAEAFSDRRNLFMLCDDEDGDIPYSLQYFPNHESSENPMHKAAAQGCMYAIDVLYASEMSSYELVDENGETPLFCAVRAGHLHVASELADRAVGVDGINHKGQGLLHAAAMQADCDVLDFVFKLVEHQVNEQDNSGQAPLHIAVSESQLGVMRWLKKKGASVNQKGQCGTPLHVAARKGNFAAACELIEMGASFDKKFEGQTAEELAKASGNNKLARYLSACRIYSLLMDKANQNIKLPGVDRKLTESIEAVDMDDMVRQYYELGCNAADNKNLLEALSYFRLASALAPNNAGLQESLGQIAYSCGDFNTASIAFNALEKLKRDLEGGIDNRAQIAAEMKGIASTICDELDYFPDFISPQDISPEMTEELERNRGVIDGIHPFVRRCMVARLEQIGLGQDGEVEQEISKLATLTKLTPKLSDAIRHEYRLLNEKKASSQQLVGVEERVKDIQNVVKFICDGGSAFVSVEGPAGAGKSSIAQAGLEVFSDDEVCCIHGKFDQFNNEPFAGFKSAIDELVKKILNGPEKRRIYFQNALRKELGENLALMVEQFPELRKLLNDTEEGGLTLDEESRSSDDGNAINKTNRFLSVFEAFVKVFTRHYPLIFCFDDLQWADGASLQAMDRLLVGGGHGRLGIIGTSRPNRAKNDLDSLKKELTEHNPQPVVVKVGNLDKLNTQKLVAARLKCKSLKAVAKLSEKIFSLTNGNAFHTKELMDDIIDREEIVFNGECYQPKSEDAFKESDEVGKLLGSRLIKISPDAQTVLIAAASLGNEFSLAELEAVLRKPAFTEDMFFFLEDSKAEKVKVLLEEAKGKELIVATGDDNECFKFAHDRIQEAADRLITAEAMKRAQGEYKGDDKGLEVAAREIEARMRLEQDYLIGGRLRTLFDGEGKISSEQNVRVMKYINRAKEAFAGNRVLKEKYAQGNKNAGDTAKKSLSFEKAYRFYAAGFEMLRDSNWSKEKSALCKGLIECAFLANHPDHAEQLFSQVMGEENLTLADKVKLFFFKMDFERRQRRPAEAMIAGKAVSEMLGFPLDVENKNEGLIFAELVKLYSKWDAWFKKDEYLSLARKIVENQIETDELEEKIRREAEEQEQNEEKPSKGRKGLFHKKTNPQDLIEELSKKQKALNELKAQLSELEPNYTELDEKTELAMLTIVKMRMAALLSHDTVAFVLLSIELMRMVMAHGYNKTILPIALNAISCLLATSTDLRNNPLIKGVNRSAKINGLVQQLLENNPDDQAGAIVYFFRSFLVDIWKYRIDDKLINLLIKSVRYAIKGGYDYLAYASITWFVYVTEARSLVEAEKKFSDLFGAIRQPNDALLIHASKIIEEINGWYANEEVFHAKVDVERWKGYLKSVNENVKAEDGDEQPDKFDADSIGMFYSQLFRELFISGQHEAAVEIFEPWAASVAEMEKKQVAPYLFPNKCFVGMSKLHLALQSDDKGKQQACFEDVEETIDWLEKNSKHCHAHIKLHGYLLKAEYLATEFRIWAGSKDKRGNRSYNDKFRQVSKALDLAIKTAEECDYLPMLAVAHERKALFFRAIEDSAGRNMDTYHDSMIEAIKTYTRWAAFAKVADLFRALFLKGDYKTAVEAYQPWADAVEALKKKMAELGQELPPQSLFVSKCFISMSQLQMALQSVNGHEQAKYLGEVEKTIKWMRDNSSKCPDHINVYKHLLVAKYHAVKFRIAVNGHVEGVDSGKLKVVMRAHERAIEQALACGSMPMLAVAYEQKALFCQAVEDADNYCASMKKALDTYRLLENHEKVLELERAHEGIKDVVKVGEVSSSRSPVVSSQRGSGLLRKKSHTKFSDLTKAWPKKGKKKSGFTLRKSRENQLDGQRPGSGSGAGGKRPASNFK